MLKTHNTFKNNKMSSREPFNIRYLLPLNYDITVPIYKINDIVQRRAYSICDAFHNPAAHDTICYFDKLKAKTSSSIRKESTNDEQEEEENREDFTLIWLDERLDTDVTDVRNISALRDVVYHLRTFTDSELCRSYIERVPKESIFLIVSGSIGRTFVPIVHDLTQIRLIYILCHRTSLHTEWASAFTKIRHDDIFHQVTPLIHRLKADLYKCRKVEGIQFKVERSLVDVHEKRADFQWSFLLVQTLIKWPRHPGAQNEMLTFLRNYYKANQSNLDFIDHFALNYKSDNAIFWYTRPGCLFQLVNRAFRDENIDDIFIYRSYVKDLSEQLDLLHAQQRERSFRTNCTLYRGTCLPYDDISVLKTSRGKLISFNGFLSTSRRPIIATLFIQPSSEQEQKEAVLFEYTIDTSLETTSYVDISDISQIPDEEEVLFNLGALFRIDNVEYDESEKRWIIRCILCAKSEIGQFYKNTDVSGTSGEFFFT
jgi:hypothetical protein